MAQTTGSCVISTSITRALLALLFFPGMLLASHIQWVADGGVRFWDLRHLLHSNEIPLLPMFFGTGCAVVWCVRYFPHSWRTVVGGSCALQIIGDDLLAYGQMKIPVADVVAVSTVNNILRKGVIIALKDGGRHYVSTIMSGETSPTRAADTIKSYLIA